VETIRPDDETPLFPHYMYTLLSLELCRDMCGIRIPVRD
jgi:hypothetical protein